MRIGDILSEDLIVTDLTSTTRDEAINEMVKQMASVRKEIDPELALRVLLERERVGSTGVGNGLAFPHARLPNLTRVFGALARSKAGVPFESIDRQPAHLLVMILAPETGGLHLKALARVSRLFKENDLRARLIGAADRHAMWPIIQAEDQRMSQNEP